MQGYCCHRPVENWNRLSVCCCHRSVEIWNRLSASPLRCRLFDFLCTVLVAEILATAFAVPVLDVAVGGRGGVHLGHMAQVAVFGGVHVTIGSQADVALGLIHAGGRAAGVSIADDGAVTVHGALQGDQAVVGQGDVGGNSQSSAGGNSQLHITLHGHIAWDAGIADDLADLFVEEHTVSNAVGIAVKGLGTGGIDPAADDLHAICGTYAMVIEMSLSVNDAVVQRDCIPGKMAASSVPTALTVLLAMVTPVLPNSAG